MTTLLPQDANGEPIPAMRLIEGGAHSIAAAATAAKNSTPFKETTKVVSVYATVPIFLKFGDSGDNAATTDHFFPDGVYYDHATGGKKHLSVIRSGGTDGTVYISEKA